MPGYKKLNVWKNAKELAVEIYRIAQGPPFDKDFGLKDQIRRSAVSIPSNIAEGDERGTNRDSVRFLYIAKGSLAELRTQLEIAHEIGYLNDAVMVDLDEKCAIIGKMLGSLIKIRSSTHP